jgi:hypothetical protein
MYLLFWLLTLIIIFPLIAFKRKRQIGETWGKKGIAKVKIDSVSLVCRHCNSNAFFKREALIHTSFLRFFIMSSFNQSGVAYTCSSCGLIHWFSRPKETAVELLPQGIKTSEVSSSESCGSAKPNE